MTIFEILGISVFTLLGSVMLVDAVRNNKPFPIFTFPLLTLSIAVFFSLNRRNRRRAFRLSGSLKDMLTSRIDVIDTYIRRVMYFLWLFFVPTLVVSLTYAAFSIEVKPLWYWAMAPAAVLAVWLAMMMQLKSSYFPQRQALNALLLQLESEK